MLAQLATETAVQAQAAAEMDLETLDGAVTVVDHLALEPDVGDLNAGAGVRAAVDVDGDRHVELSIDVLEPLLEFGHQCLCPLAGLGERQLAELDAGAGHQVAPPVRRRRRKTQRVQPCAQLVELVVGHVQDDQLLIGREADAVRPRRLGQVGDLAQDGARDASGDGRDPDGVEAVTQLLHPDVVDGAGHRVRSGAVDQRALQVLLFENLPELLDAPVLDQELQPRLGAQAAVTVVAERADHCFPDVGHLVERHPGADSLAEHRVRRQPAADPQVEPGTVLGVVDADERHVVDLVHDVLQTGDRGLELARKVGQLLLADVALDDLVDRGGAVDDLVERLTGQRRAQHDTGAVAAGLGGLQADCVQAPPDLGHVLDADPVVLDVLAVGDVGGVAGELGRDLTQRAQRGGGQRAAVTADPQHEVRVLEHVGVLVAGPGAVVALLALGVEPPPAKTATQVALVDGLEAVLGVDVLDAVPHVERIVVLLGLLVGVERLAVAECPLALTAGALGGLLGWGVGRIGLGRRAGRIGRRHRWAPGRSRRSDRAWSPGGCPAAQIRRPAERSEKWLGCP